MVMFGGELIDDVRKLGRSPEIREMELPGVVKTGLLMIISGIVVGGGMWILWSLCWLLDPFEDFSAKAIGSNTACLSILFAIALMIWWALMSSLVPYRRERRRSWKKWKKKLSESERLILSELFKLRYSEYVEQQGEKRLTPRRQERHTLKEEDDILRLLIPHDEAVSPQDLAEWVRKNWKQFKRDHHKSWKKVLCNAKKQGEGGEDVELNFKLCEMLDVKDPPEEKVLLKSLEKIFAISQKDKNDYLYSRGLKILLVKMFPEDEDEKPWREFFFNKRRKNLIHFGFMKHLEVNREEAEEEAEAEEVEVEVVKIYELTLPAWRLLEYLERRGALP